MKNTLAVILALTLMFLSGCGAPAVSAEPSPTPAQVSPADNSAVVVARIDGQPVMMDEFLYYVSQSLLVQENDNAAMAWDMDVDGTPLSQYAKTDALDTAKLYRAMESLASDEGVELSDASRQHLDSLHESCVAELGSEAAYAKWLDDSFLTEELFEYANYISCLYSDIYSSLYASADKSGASEEDILAFAEDNSYIKITHIIIYTTDELTGQPLDTDAKAEKLARAEAALAALDGGGDFMDVAAEYTEAASWEPYCFTPGQMVKSFEDAAYALSPGQYSGIIETDYGYHIIYRMETDPQEIWDDYYSYTLLDRELISRMESMAVETTLDYDSFDTQSVFGEYFDW